MQFTFPEPPIRLPNPFSVRHLPQHDTLMHHPNLHPELKALGEMLGEVENPADLEKYFDQLQKEKRKKRLSKEEVLIIADAAYENVTYRNTPARAMIDVFFFRHYARINPNCPQIHQAVTALIEATERKIQLNDLSAAGIAAEMSLTRQALHKVDPKKFPQRHVPIAAPQVASREDRLADLHNVMTSQIDTFKLKRKHHYPAQEIRDGLKALGETVVKIAVLTGNSQTELAMLCKEKILELEPPLSKRSHISLRKERDERIASYFEGALHALPSQATYAYSLLSLAYSEARLSAEPTLIVNFAPDMALSQAAIARHLPQDYEHLRRVVENIEGYVMTARRKKPEPQPEDVISIYERAIADSRAYEPNSLFLMMLELSRAQCVLKYFPADFEAAERIGYYEASIAYRRGASPSEIVQLSENFLGQKTRFHIFFSSQNPPIKIKNTMGEKVSDEQREYYLRGAIEAAQTRSPEELLLTHKLYKFNLKQLGSSTEIDPDMEQRVATLTVCSPHLGQRPATFSSALTAFLKTRRTRPSRQHPAPTL